MTLKKYKNWLAVLAALVVLPALPVQAADTAYRIDITDDAATSLQELDITEHDVGEGDVVSHQIFVDNHTSNGHLVQLKNIEVVNDSILLDKLNFEFENGTTVVPFTKNTLTQAYNKELFRVGDKGTGDLTLRMTVNGDLDNSYQGTSCTLRYTFEIISLNQGVPESKAETPPQAETLPQTFGEIIKGLLPNTGEGKAYLLTLVGVMLLLSFFLLGKRRKEKEDEA